jgi:predicted amidohydrolase YtcJ
MSDTVVFATKRTITMNPNRPSVTHIAVRDGKVLTAGSKEEIDTWGDFPVDNRFADKILMPGLVEGHSHIMEGALWAFIYTGFHDRMDPDGKVWDGAPDLEAVVQRLIESEKQMTDADAPLVAWGFDPIYYPGAEKCRREDLDRVSASRIIVMMHASGHIINTNSAGLKAIDWLKTGLNHPGLPLGEDGIPTGELKGPEAMGPIMSKTPLSRGFLGADEDGLARFGRLCVRRGVTTATDLASPVTDEILATMLKVTGDDNYPVRVVPLLRMLDQPVPETIDRAVELTKRSTERLRLGRVKVVVDGSIQGFSARLRWPGYYNGAENGLWYTAPEQLKQGLQLGLSKGVHMHLHTNGDEATELVLDTMTELARTQPLGDHRYTLQHCQLADEAQFRRMKPLGMCVNLFANHTFYWGDEHYTLTVGPERAERMNACATALRVGVPLAIHSDAPVTPLGPLFTAWCAVNRKTASGRVQGEHQRISVEDALRTITLGAAYTLKLDDEIGSIESGKRADFCVLEQDPTDVDPDKLRDVPVWGTVLGGRVFEAATISD